MFVVVAVVFVVQMTVVQVVDVVIVFDGGVAAAFTVNVVVFVMCFAGHDGFLHEMVACSGRISMCLSYYFLKI